MMSRKFLISGIAILASFVPNKSVNANPSSCRVSAFTASEKEAVEILEDMYYLQLDMDDIDKDLEELNRQRSFGYDPYDADSVDKYNELVYEYNSIVDEKNFISHEYNLLKDSFNAMIYKISPSTNTTFIHCIDMAVLNLNTRTISLDVNSTSLSIDSMNIETENMMRSLENISY